MVNNFQDNRLDIYIDIVRKHSTWGKTQTISNYEKYIIQELVELNEAIMLNDLINITEEIADVYMMLCFYWRESLDNGKMMSSYFKNILPYLEKTMLKHSIPLDDLKRIICSKLEQRYPVLLSQQLSFFFDDCPYEELFWEERKRYYKMLEFCSCSNSTCSNYHKPYNGSNLIIHTKSRNKNYIFCTFCQKKLSLKESFIFFGINKDYKIALKVAIDYFTSNNNDVYKKYNISSSTFNCIIKRCVKNYDVLKKIADIRYPHNLLPNTLDIKSE